VISLTHDITQDIILPPGFTLYGRVTTNSVGVANVDIFAQDPTSPAGFGISATDANGFYTGTLPAGNFDIVVTNVTGPPDSEQDVVFPPGYTVSGQVTCHAGLPNVFVLVMPEPPVSAGSFPGWGRFTAADGYYALALQSGTYTFSVDWPGGSRPDRIVPGVEVTQDLTLDFGACTVFLPLIVKPLALDLIDDFDDGQDPNALGGFSSTAWPAQCPPTISGDYDPSYAYSGSYGYRLSYNVTPICYGVWQTDLRGWDYSGFSTLTFWIKGASDNEQPHIYLQDSDNCQITTCRHFVNVGSFLPTGRVTTNWQQAKIPMSIFAVNGVILTRLRFFQIAFEFANMNGAIYIDEIRFE
jgi:hypothetical protein